MRISKPQALNNYLSGPVGPTENLDNFRAGRHSIALNRNTFSMKTALHNSAAHKGTIASNIKPYIAPYRKGPDAQGLYRGTPSPIPSAMPKRFLEYKKIKKDFIFLESPTSSRNG